MTAAEEIARELSSNIDPSKTIDGTISIDMGDDGQVLIDGRTAPARIEATSEEGDCRMKCSAETFVGLLDGSINGTRAFMTGKLRIAGKQSLAEDMEKLFIEK